MSITKQSSDAIAARLAAIPAEIKARVAVAVTKGAEDVADRARALAEASRRTGDTIGTINVTKPGQTTPAYAQGGASVETGEMQSLVTVGSPEVRTAHLIEFGSQERKHEDGTPTGKVTAMPFMRPAWRLAKARVERRIQAAIRRGIKDALSAGNGGGDAA